MARALARNLATKSVLNGTTDSARCIGKYRHVDSFGAFQPGIPEHELTGGMKVTFKVSYHLSRSILPGLRLRWALLSS